MLLDRDVRTLDAIAGRLADTIHGLLTAIVAYERSAAFTEAVRQLELFDKKFSELVSQRRTAQGIDDALIGAALRAVSAALADSTSTTARMIVRSGSDLEIIQAYGSDWDSLDPKTQARVRARTFPLHAPEPSVGRAAIEHDRVQVCRDGALQHPPIFEGTIGLMVAPIGILGDQKFGVLDVRSTRGNLPDFYEDLVGMFARHLGLSLTLLSALASTDELAESQSNAIDDLEHQLGSPLASAIRSIRDMSRTLPDTTGLRRAEALCKSAARVASHVHLFKDLEAGRIRPNPRTLSASDVRAEVRSSLDVIKQLLADEKPRVTVSASYGGLRQLGSAGVRCDPDHYAQCLVQVVDNARKYCWEDGKIELSFGSDSDGLFVTSVMSEGVELALPEVDLAVQRKWRSEHARWTNSDGSGLGLYLVDKLMRANGGYVRLRPAGDRTTVELAIPRAQKTMPRGAK